MQPAVFLDLDKTIVQDTGGSPDPASLVLMHGAAPAIASLRGLGYRIVVVANHDGVARGRLTEDDVEAIHKQVAALIGAAANGAVIDAFYYCPFHPQGNLKQYKKDHANRKPKPGMLTQAAEEMKLELSMSWMIGDELADVQAGRAAGARTILLRPDADRLRPIDASQMKGVTAESPDKDRPSGPDFFAVGLIDAARLIAQQPRVDQSETKRAEPGRKWDAEKIAKIQVARPLKKQAEQPVPAAPAGRSFRPWGAAASQEDEKPIVAKPFRKRMNREAEGAGPATGPATATPEATPAASDESRDIPDPIRQAIEQKRKAAAGGAAPEPGVDKTLRLILQELRSQRGTTQEFSYLTIIAVALQLVAIVCVLGGLFMGGSSDGLFLRWFGVALIAQLTAIATLLYGR